MSGTVSLFKKRSRYPQVHAPNEPFGMASLYSNFWPFGSPGISRLETSSVDDSGGLQWAGCSVVLSE